MTIATQKIVTLFCIITALCASLAYATNRHQACSEDGATGTLKCAPVDSIQPLSCKFDCSKLKIGELAGPENIFQCRSKNTYIEHGWTLEPSGKCITDYEVSKMTVDEQDVLLKTVMKRCNEIGCSTRGGAEAAVSQQAKQPQKKTQKPAKPQAKQQQKAKQQKPKPKQQQQPKQQKQAKQQQQQQQQPQKKAKLEEPSNIIKFDFANEVQPIKPRSEAPKKRKVVKQTKDYHIVEEEEITGDDVKSLEQQIKEQEEQHAENLRKMKEQLAQAKRAKQTTHDEL